MEEQNKNLQSKCDALEIDLHKSKVQLDQAIKFTKVTLDSEDKKMNRNMRSKILKFQQEVEELQKIIKKKEREIEDLKKASMDTVRGLNKKLTIRSTKENAAPSIMQLFTGRMHLSDDPNSIEGFLKQRLPKGARYGWSHKFFACIVNSNLCLFENQNDRGSIEKAACTYNTS